MRTVSRLTAVGGVLIGVGALVSPSVAQAATFVVTTTADTSDGVCAADCSLRDAIGGANATPGADTISFAVAGTITLTSDLPSITSAVTIAGPGANLLTIDGANLHSAFITTPASSLSLEDITITRARSDAGLAGAALFADANARIDRVAFVDNHAPANGGGAVWVNQGLTVITNSTFDGNSTTGEGGAIGVPNAASLYVANSTFTGNSAPAGGVLYGSNLGNPAVIVNSTIAGNTATNPGASIVAAHVTVRNSVIADNTGVDCSVSSGVSYSLVSDGSCVTAGVDGNRTGAAGLGALTGNPAYFPLTATSQAVNAGSNALALAQDGSPLTTDQAGAPRIQHTTVDMGATESSFTGIPAVAISRATIGVNEGASTALTIARSGASIVDPLAVDLSISGTATATADYTLSGGAITAQTGNATVTIPAGSASVAVTVTALDDTLDEADDTLTLALAAAPAYTLGSPASSTVTIVDTDSPPTLGISDVALIEGNAGLTGATFTVTQSGVSGQTVAVNYFTSDGTASAGSDYVASSGTLIFSPGETTKTITVSIMGDQLAEPNETFTVNLSASTNATIADAQGIGTIVNDDTAGVTVVPAVGLMTTEAGGVASFTVRLTSQPTDDVVVALASSDATEGVVSPSSLTFTAVNWNVAQTVTVTGVDDAIDDGDIAFTVGLTVTSDDAVYDEFEVPAVSVSNTDDDGAGVMVVPAVGLVTTEAGGAAPFSVLLTSQPTGDVIIAIASSDTTEGVVSPSPLTFTPANWNVAQTATVTGVNDAVDDGDIAFTVGLMVTSDDPTYDEIAVTPVSATNTDDDTAGVTLDPSTDLVTTEAGGTATFTVRLTSQPTGDVAFALASSDTTEGVVSPSSLTFTPANWNVGQTVTVTGVDDAVDDGDIAFTVSPIAASDDPTYDEMAVTPVSATNTDDDTAGVTLDPSTNLVTTEPGGTATFTVQLTSQPTGDVAFALASSDTTEGVVSPSSLTFTAANWNVAQTVTVTGVDDAVDDGDIAFTLSLMAASDDPTYDEMAVTPVSATNTDDDTAGVTLDPSTNLVTTEAGGTATFTVRLTSQPTGDVAFALASSDTTEGVVSPSPLTFTPANWNVAQTATVTGVNDAVDDGDIAFTVGLMVTSGDAMYDEIAVTPVSATNTDDDTAGVTLDPSTDLITTEAGGTATFTVRLTSQPTGDVVIAVTSSDTTEASLRASPLAPMRADRQQATDQLVLTFTPANWSIPQTVTVTGVDDALDDDTVHYSITFSVESADPAYDGLAVPAIGGANTDNDVTPPAPTPPPPTPVTELPATGTGIARSVAIAGAILACGLLLLRARRFGSS